MNTTDASTKKTTEKPKYLQIGNVRFFARDPLRNYRNELHQSSSEVLIWEGSLALALIERWGLVTAADGGEDSTGRAKLRRQTPQELVANACETAELTVAALRARGWALPLPLPHEMIDQLSGPVKDED